VCFRIDKYWRSVLEAVSGQAHNLKVGGSIPSTATKFAPVTELVYVLVLEAKFYEFESPLGHQITMNVNVF
jgi:hypothetical protein